MLEKRNVDLKTRRCADKRRQRLWTDKIDVSSPTPVIEAIIHMLAVSTFEERDVSYFDLPAQFLQTKLDEVLFLCLKEVVALL